ncbi:uncharacterized protein LOC106865788 [Brachypodium distachyon]|uniref:uncharacterized protein LOC106865788 n=1 Tax=Brachypodium distachyon TaxID=15368 RepID=UPI000D0CC8B4|nr:uncharacterized protein LOC106865788 [Brachypodium distachyon]|eukprot:XP_014752087.2 uncharacterized protein LOC106865788 [Brachypodium distachyon]
MQRREQGAGKTEDLLHLDFEAAIKQVVQYFKQLSPGPPDDEAFWDKYDEPQLFKVYQRLALYRIKDQELKSTGKKLDIAQLKREYRPAILQAESYFRRYEKNLEWCFDPELCQRASLNDYQRLVIHDDGSYADWDYYRLTYHTYEGDAEYVSYCEEMSNAIKWIDEKVGLDKHQWERYKSIAYLQALKIAIAYHNIYRDAVMGAFNSLQFDYDNRNDFYAVYLEIWKRVAKDKMEFVPAVKQIYEENMFPPRNSDIKLAMENHPLKFRASVKDNYSYVACIDEKTSEDKARLLIIEAVKKMSPKWKKSYLDYARKKMQIAVRVGL